DLQTSRALFARIFEYLDLVPAITDAADAREVDADRLGEVGFREVTFRYPDAAPDAAGTLQDVSFRIEKGQYVAFVDPSGADKSTVLCLFPRLYVASDGAVLFAGDDVRTLRHASRIDHIGVVSHETYLFHATIADNLRYAKPDATQDELEAA